MRQLILISLLVLANFAMTACGGAGTATREELNDLRPYVPSSPYADVITGCAQVNTLWAACSLTTLPPLAMEIPEPDIDDVMSRVVVSHDWMGLRFKQLLGRLPEDMLYLFGAVTAIVIDDDIRPSYYWSLTGAIYLDPARLWLTLEEKDSISRKEDYRAGNDSEMRLRYYVRQAINGADAARYYGLDSQVERPLEDIVIPMANLLFHELAHANDQFPRSSYDQVNRQDSISYVTQGLDQDIPSTHLVNSSPLTSSLLMDLGDIFYRGHEPTEEQKHWQAHTLGNAFADDGASDNYAYSTQYEDLAMLFEDAMMHLYFGTEKEIAFIEAPDQKAPPCGEAIIGWGARNRIGDPLVKQRIQLVMAEILPDRDYSERIAAIEEPTDLSGLDWCAMVDEQRRLADQATQAKSHPMELLARPRHRQ